MKVNPMDWPARPDLEATIAQQRARIVALEEALRESMVVAVRDGRASSQTLKKRLRDQDWYDKATRALFSPAPADTAHEEETP